MKRLLPLLIFIGYVSIYAQNKESKITQTDSISCDRNSKEYTLMRDKLLDFYTIMLNSDISKKYNKLRTELRSKVHYDGSADQRPKISEMYIWIKANLNKTDFATYEEAEMLLKMIKEVHTTMFNKNIELYKYIQEALKVCGQPLLTDVYLELQIQYGSEFHV